MTDQIQKQVSDILAKHPLPERKVDHIIAMLVKHASEIDSIITISRTPGGTYMHHSISSRQTIGELEMAKHILMDEVAYPDGDNEFGAEDEDNGR